MLERDPLMNPKARDHQRRQKRRGEANGSSGTTGYSSYLLLSATQLASEAFGGFRTL